MQDIGIDLGTSSTIVYVGGKGIVLCEPSVVAINIKDESILTVGDEAYKMLGKTPGRIRAMYPLENGVISDYKAAQAMVKYFINKICKNSSIKPRISLCVPSGITNVEASAVVDAAVFAGARKVYLIEEPVAAAIGAGIDITKPKGNLIVDIGGGTTDYAVISLSGIAEKASIRVAGNTINQSLIKYVREKYSILIGEKMADEIKREIASVYFDKETEEKEFVLKGRNLLTGLPSKQIIKRSEIYPVVLDIALQIVNQIPVVMSQTPPELSSDVFENGIILTGGGALLHGLDRLITERTGTKCIVAENPEQCVAIGTGRAFEYLGKLVDGFVNPSTCSH